jgi:O-acetyl-ADP-ribose deacetylase (regulator of RNase III)
MITYVHGDATSPSVKGPKIIAHICNDIGKWGKGFVMAVSKKWPKTRSHYLDWYSGRAKNDQTMGSRLLMTGPCKLGEVQLIEVVEEDIFVVNMVAQHGIGTGSNGPPIRYPSLALCLDKLVPLSNILGATVHMPRIGTGLAGGKWEEIEPLLEKALQGQQVHVYDFDTE